MNRDIFFLHKSIIIRNVQYIFTKLKHIMKERSKKMFFVYIEYVISEKVIFKSILQARIIKSNKDKKKKTLQNIQNLPHGNFS